MTEQWLGASGGNHDQFFRLQEGEEIIEAIKPLTGLKWMFFFQGVIGWFFLMFFFSMFLIPFMFFLAAFGGAGAAIGMLLGSILVLVLFLVIPYIIASLSYGKRFYWVTTKRVIGKSGLIGYKVNSIPLERISDVIISRSFVEGIFGFGSIHIQTMAGQISYRGRFGAEGNLQAVPDPEELQQTIFELVKRKRKDEKLTM